MASRTVPFGERGAERSGSANIENGERDARGRSPPRIVAPHLNQIPTTPDIPTDSAFDRLLSAALSTVIAILLAWRFLIIEDEKNTGSMQSTSLISISDHKPKAPKEDRSESKCSRLQEVFNDSIDRKGQLTGDDVSPEPIIRKENQQNQHPTSCRSGPPFASPIQRNLPSNFCHFSSGGTVGPAWSGGVTENDAKEEEERMKFIQRPSAGTTRGNPNNRNQPWEGGTAFVTGDHSLASSSERGPQEPFSSLRRPLIAPPDKEEFSLQNIESDSQSQNTQTGLTDPEGPPGNSASSLSSLKLLLSCGDDNIPSFASQMDSPSQDQSRIFESETVMYRNEEDALMVDHFESDASSEHGALPAYLDTITEEDTDDLTSQSSGRFSPLKIKAQADIPSPTGGSFSISSRNFEDSSDTDSAGFNKFESTDTIIYLEEEEDDLGNEAGDESSSEDDAVKYRVPKHQPVFSNSSPPYLPSRENVSLPEGIAFRGRQSEKAPLVVLTEIDTMDTFSTPSSPMPHRPGSQLEVSNPAASSCSDKMDVFASPEEFSGGEWPVRSGVPSPHHTSRTHGETGGDKVLGGEINDASRHLPTSPTSTPPPPLTAHCSSLPLSQPQSHSRDRTERADFSLFVTQVNEEDEFLNSCQNSSEDSNPSPRVASFEQPCTPISRDSADESEGRGNENNSIRTDTSPESYEEERASIDSLPQIEEDAVNHVPVKLKSGAVLDNDAVLLYHDFSDFPRPADREKQAQMEIDLKRVMERFARYGAVYGDAPSSGMEEFNPKPKKRDSDSVSSRSSIVSLGSSFVPPESALNSMRGENETVGPFRASHGEFSIIRKDVTTTVVKREGQTEEDPTGISSFSPAACHSDGVTQQPVYEGNFAGPSIGTSPSGPPPALPESSPPRDEVLWQAESSKRPSLPPPSPPHSSLPQEFSKDKDSLSHKDGGLNSFLTEREEKSKVGSAVDLDGTFSSEGEIIVATASSQLVGGPDSHLLLDEASANAVSRNPYVALARATASAASKLSPDYPTSPVRERSQDHSTEKFSIVVATTLTTTEKELRSPKSRNFLENSTKLHSQVSSIHSGRSSAAQPPTTPSFDSNPAQRSPSPGIHHTDGNGNAHIQGNSGNQANYNNMKSQPSMIPRPSVDSWSRKRPLLQQQSQQTPGASHSSPQPQIPARQGSDALRTLSHTSALSPTPSDTRYNSWQYSATENAIMDDGTPKLSRTQLTFSPEPQRILPPSSWIEEEPRKHVISPRGIEAENSLNLPKSGNSDTEKEKENNNNLGSMTLSSEHLQKLLTGTGTPKIISSDKTEETPLIKENVAIWENIPENTLSNKQNLMRWRNSCNLNDNDVPGKTGIPSQPEDSLTSETIAPLLTGLTTQSETQSFARSASPFSVLSISGTDNGELTSVDHLRKYQRKLADESMEEMRNSRRNKYKAKIEKARREFIEAPANGSISDLYKTREEFEKKFKVSMEEVARPVNPARGPLLQKINSEYKTKIDLKDLPPVVFARMPESKYDKEYKSIVAEAEQRWAAKRRQAPLDDTLYARSRAYSTGYLESTNLDTSIETAPSETSKDARDTPPDEMIRQNSGTQSVIGTHTHESRSRFKDAQTEAKSREAKHRARSVDYLMDQAGREEMEPPENQLKKILGDASTDHLSEHEIRFRKSVEKLHVPGWYLNSEFCQGNKSDPNQSYNSIATSYAPVFTPATPEPPPFPEMKSLGNSRPQTAQSNYQYLKTVETTKLPHGTETVTTVVKEPKVESVDGSESSWNGMERTNGLYSSDRTYQKRREQPLRTKIVSKMESSASKQRDPAYLPTNFFSKYKDEIEHLRLSRSSLRLNKSGNDVNQQGSSDLADHRTTSNVPVATIRPRAHLQEFQDRSSSSLSEPQSAVTSNSVLDRKSPPSYFHQKPPPSLSSQIHEESFDERRMITSTPNSSVQLQRKPPPIPPPRPSTLVPAIPPRQPEIQLRNDGLSNTWETKRHEGYSVSALPAEWNQAGNRNSRVIEVADTFSDPRGIRTGPDGRRIAGQITLDEVLDGMLGLPHQRRLSTLDESSASLDSFGPLPKVYPETPTSEFGPGIFAKDSNLMDRVAKSPERASELLKFETLVVRCDYCGKTKELEEAKKRYVSCKHCYSYYCSRICRRSDWMRHRDKCNFARVNTLCKEIILKVREDPEAQWQLSRVARQGNQSRGRGSVNFRFQSPFLAETFVAGGWAELSQFAGNHLYYYTVQDLVDGRKDPNLIALCRRYDPGKKLILSVSIVADIDECPETPPSQRSQKTEQDANAMAMAATPAPFPSPISGRSRSQHDNISQGRNEARSDPYQPTRNDPRREVYSQQSNYIPPPQQNFQRTQSLPHRSNKSRQQEPDAKSVLKSVLRSMENIAPGMPPELAEKLAADEQRKAAAQQTSHFSRANRSRHTVGNFNTRPHFGSSPMVTLSGSRPHLYSNNDPTVV